MTTDLFSAAAARTARDEAMQRVDENANPGWKAFTYELIVEVARSSVEFTTDDVERLRFGRGGGPSTQEPRAMGPLMLKAARSGICEKTGRLRESVQASNHGRPMQLWRSLIYDGAR